MRLIPWLVVGALVLTVIGCSSYGEKQNRAGTEYIVPAGHVEWERFADDPNVLVSDTPDRSVRLTSDSALPLDARVLNDMHRINHVEMMAGQLGMEKGRTEATRRYGEHLWRDHRAHDEMVISTSRKAGIELYEPRPTELERQALARIERVSGAEFDRAFAEEMCIAHEQAVMELERAQPGVANDDVRTLVNQTIPTLRSHERIAVDLSVD